MLMVAAHALDAFRVFVDRTQGAAVLLDALVSRARRARGFAAELTSLPGTTPRCGRFVSIRRITYLQVLYPFPDQVRLLTQIHARFGDEVVGHLEFTRFNGKITCFGLPLVRFTTEGVWTRSSASMRTWGRRSSIRTAIRWKKAA